MEEILQVWWKRYYRSGGGDTTGLVEIYYRSGGGDTVGLKQTCAEKEDRAKVKAA